MKKLLSAQEVMDQRIAQTDEFVQRSLEMCIKQIAKSGQVTLKEGDLGAASAFNHQDLFKELGYEVTLGTTMIDVGLFYQGREVATMTLALPLHKQQNSNTGTGAKERLRQKMKEKFGAT